MSAFPPLLSGTADAKLAGQANPIYEYTPVPNLSTDSSGRDKQTLRAFALHSHHHLFAVPIQPVRLFIHA
jgi:hypothetical protein